MLNQNSTIPLYEQVKEAIKLKMEGKYQSSIGNGINENL